MASKSSNVNLENNRDDIYRNALKLRVAGKFTEAIEEFKKVVALAGDNKETYRQIAEISTLLNQFDQAAIYYQKIIDQDQKDARAHWALSKILVTNLGEYERGIKEAETSKSLYNDNKTSFIQDYIIAKAYDGLSDYNMAIKHYKLFLDGQASISKSAVEYIEVKNRLNELQ